MTDSNQLDEENLPIHPIQRLLDNPFLLLALGVAMPTLIYIVWGIMEIISIPIAK